MRAVRIIIYNNFHGERGIKPGSIWEDIVDPMAAPSVIPSSHSIVSV